MSDTDDALQDVEGAVERVETAVERVEAAVARVEAAVKSKWSSAQWVLAVLIFSLLWSVPGDIWRSKWRYGLNYDLPSDQIIIDDHPHDCAFLAAPLGEKYCHYEREVETLRWATSTAGFPIASWDDGKTWSAFTPDAGVTIPKTSTVKQVHISWKKIED